MRYVRMPIEIEAPEEKGYSTIKYNLAESSMRDIAIRDLDINLSDLVLFYGEHRGLGKLREAVKDNSRVLSADDVLVTSGAATALFVVATTLLDREDHLVVIRPNYGTNLETPRAIGCNISIIDLSFDDGFEIDIDKVSEAIKPNTKLISITNPHNPTGKLFSKETIYALISLAEKYNCRLLIDETYRELNFQASLDPYVAELSDRVISVSSVSKAYGAPGIRIGWIICRDHRLMLDFLAAKEQVSLCNSIVDEEIAWYLLNNKQRIIPANHMHIIRNFEYLKKWMSEQSFMEWVEPQAGVVCFPRVKSKFKLDAADFDKILYEQYKTIVGPGHWFEQDKSYLRIGFGYPTSEELAGGLAAVGDCLKKSLI